MTRAGYSGLTNSFDSTEDKTVMRRTEKGKNFKYLKPRTALPAKVMRHAGHHNTRPKQEPAFEHEGGLVMEQMLPPGTRNKLRQDYCNDGVLMLSGLRIDEVH